MVSWTVRLAEVDLLPVYEAEKFTLEHVPPFPCFFTLMSTCCKIYDKKRLQVKITLCPMIYLNNFGKRMD